MPYTFTGPLNSYNLAQVATQKSLIAIATEAVLFPRQVSIMTGGFLWAGQILAVQVGEDGQGGLYARMAVHDTTGTIKEIDFVNVGNII